MTDRLTVSKGVAVVVTTINPPTPAMESLARGCVSHGLDLIIVGDSKSPAGFFLNGARYFDMAAQRGTRFRFAQTCPERHYARKNIGYLLAIEAGARIIIETDDDNAPTEGFWDVRRESCHAPVLVDAGWVNTYRYFTARAVWPRGLPLDAIRARPPALEGLQGLAPYCPVQQGLADGDPDVDAIFRLVSDLPLCFDPAPPVALGRGSWCPFNSQNTTFFAPAFPLMYLPFHCSFRMTDIWRSFVAQAIMQANDWQLLFHRATVFQDRNEHDLMRDFSQEVVGYLNNRRIVDALRALPLVAGSEHIPANLVQCYACLIRLGVVGAEELDLLHAWLSDLEAMHPAVRRDPQT